jgi:hypothetical protein
MAGTMAVAAAWGARKAATALWNRFSENEIPVDLGEEQPTLRESVTALVASALTAGLASVRDGGSPTNTDGAASPEPSSA